jgi:hypothetical protein
MRQQKFAIEHNIQNEYINKRHVHAKILTRIYSAEVMLLFELLNNSGLKTIEIFENLYMHTLSETFLSQQEYKDKTIKITAFNILFTNYAS